MTNHPLLLLLCIATLIASSTSFAFNLMQQQQVRTTIDGSSSPPLARHHRHHHLTDEELEQQVLNRPRHHYPSQLSSFLETKKSSCRSATTPEAAAATEAEQQKREREFFSFPRRSDCVLNVLDYGAKGNGVDLDTEAIQRTFHAIQGRSGCTVLFPGPRLTFLTGPFNVTGGVAAGGRRGGGGEVIDEKMTTPDLLLIVPHHLPPATTIHIQHSATIKFSSNRSLHPLVCVPPELANCSHLARKHQPLILGANIAQLTIQGLGTIDGDGYGWWPSKPSGMHWPGWAAIPPCIFTCFNCPGLHINGPYFRNSPFVFVNNLASKDTLIENIELWSPIWSPNTAGLYMDSVVDAVARHNVLNVGDDHITVMASHSHASNVTMTNNLFLAGQGMSIGSPVHFGMTDVTYKDSVMQGGLTAVRIKAQRAHGGVLKNLRWENLQLQSVGIMISVESNFVHQNETSATPPIINDVVIKNISYSWGDMAGVFRCIPESPCSGWKLIDVFPIQSSEVVLPYLCNSKSYFENAQVIWTNATKQKCGHWPALENCPGMKCVEEH